MTSTTLDESLLEGSDITVLRPGSTEFDAARVIWNAMFDRHPLLILQPKSTEGVARAVKFARANDLPIAVKCGGHSAPGHSMCGSEGVVIDLVDLQKVAVDPVKKEARGQGGALLGRLDEATAPHGLVVPAGVVSHTGMGGLVLGGGFGHIMRKFGLSIDSLLSAEVVLADGSVVRADTDHHADLFWALRGGSGNFGIVTEFHFKCHDFGPSVAVAIAVIELEHAQPALELWSAEMEDGPDELSWISFLRNVPDRPEFAWVPRELVDKPVLIMPMLWAGDPEEGEQRLAQLTDKLENLAVLYRDVLPYVLVQQQYDDIFGYGYRTYCKAGFINDLNDAAIGALLDSSACVPNSLSQIEILRLGGAVERVAEDETAFSHRKAKYPINIIAMWDDASRDDETIGWVRQAYSSVEPFLNGGIYVNYAGGDETGGDAAAYGATWDRLVALKEKWDPDNVFRFNANLRRAELVT